MKILTQLEKIFLYPSESNSVGSLLNMSLLEEEDWIEVVISKLKDEVVSSCGENNKILERIDFSKRDSIWRLILFKSIENGFVNNSANIYGVTIGKDIYGATIAVNIKENIVGYANENGEVTAEIDSWKSDSVGKYLIIDNKKTYRKSMINYCVLLAKSQDKESSLKYLDVLGVLNKAKIMTDDYGYYIADENLTNKETERLAVYLSSSFAYRKQKQKLLSIFITKDIIDKNIKRKEFVEKFSSEIAIGIEASSFVDSKKLILKNISKFSKGSSGVIISIISRCRKIKEDTNFVSIPKEVYVLK